MKTDLEYLTKARAMVEHGWCKNEPYNFVGNVERVCATFALMKVADYDTRWQTLSSSCRQGNRYMHLVGMLAEGLPNYSESEDSLNYSFDCGVIQFNDRPGTTQQDVLELYDRAIAKLTHHLPCGCSTDGQMCEEHAPSICCQSLDDDMRKEFECRCKEDACT